MSEIFIFEQNMEADHIKENHSKLHFEQGTLTEGEGSVQLVPLLKQSFAKKKKKYIFSLNGAQMNQLVQGGKSY